LSKIISFNGSLKEQQRFTNIPALNNSDRKATVVSLMVFFLYMNDSIHNLFRTLDERLGIYNYRWLSWFIRQFLQPHWSAVICNKC